MSRGRFCEQRSCFCLQLVKEKPSTCTNHFLFFPSGAPYQISTRNFRSWGWKFTFKPKSSSMLAQLLRPDIDMRITLSITREAISAGQSPDNSVSSECQCYAKRKKTSFCFQHLASFRLFARSWNTQDQKQWQSSLVILHMTPGLFNAV